jgi:hypothetical protein
LDDAAMEQVPDITGATPARAAFATRVVVTSERGRRRTIQAADIDRMEALRAPGSALLGETGLAGVHAGKDELIDPQLHAIPDFMRALRENRAAQRSVVRGARAFLPLSPEEPPWKAAPNS